MADLTVFIPTHGRPVLLRRTLESLAASAVGGDGGAETEHAGGFIGLNRTAYVSEAWAAGGFDSDFEPASPYNASGQETTRQAALRTSRTIPIYVPYARVVLYVLAGRVPSSGRSRGSTGRRVRRGATAQRACVVAPAREAQATVRLVGAFAPHALRGDQRARTGALAALDSQAGYWAGYTRSGRSRATSQ